MWARTTTAVIALGVGYPAGLAQAPKQPECPKVLKESAKGVSTLLRAGGRKAVSLAR